MQDQKGSALVLVMLTVAALLIVGVSLVAASTVEYRSSVNHGHSTQAFFVAEAGLNWARLGLRSGTIALPTIVVGQEVVLYRNAAFGTPVVGLPVASLDAIGPIEVRVRRLTANTLQIESRGRQHQAQRMVSMLITETGGAGSGSLPTSHHTRNPMTQHNHAVLIGEVNANRESFNYPDVRVPSLPPEQPNRNRLEVKSATAITASGHYTDLIVNGPLTITPGNTDLIIVANTLVVGNQGSIQIGAGTRSVIIHVINTITLDGSIGLPGTVDRLQVIQHGDIEVRLENRGIFHGSLITNSANIRIDNSAAVSGLLLTNSTANDAIRIRNFASVGTANQGVLLYVPNGKVDIDNHANVFGVVIAEDLHVGKATLTLNRTGVPSSAPFVTFGGGGTTFSFSNWNTQP
ncbi:MAG: pilus assembly PilX N-terminal domain-containing protein [Thermaerobacter sp.]|nr:pilus assembly PilX N-terminal domain-containing protein [Thermaerobacter sp.]